MGVLMGVGRLPFPERERLGPKAGVEIDRGPQQVQHFPTALRGEQSQFELLPDERAACGGEFLLSSR